MIELDANGNVPRRDEKCRVFRIVGAKDGKAWASFNLWNGTDSDHASIELSPMFRGWVTDIIDGSRTSDEPSRPDPGQGIDRTGNGKCNELRVGLFNSASGRPFLSLWLGGDRMVGQTSMARSPSFVRWVTDTFEVTPTEIDMLEVRKYQPAYTSSVCSVNLPEDMQELLHRVSSDDEYHQLDYADGDYYYVVDLKLARRDRTPNDVVQQALEGEAVDYPYKGWTNERVGQREDLELYSEWLLFVRYLVSRLPEEVVAENKFAIHCING